jgi:hypothetical protein
LEEIIFALKHRLKVLGSREYLEISTIEFRGY